MTMTRNETLRMSKWIAGNSKAADIPSVLALATAALAISKFGCTPERFRALQSAATPLAFTAWQFPARLRAANEIDEYVVE